MEGKESFHQFNLNAFMKAGNENDKMKMICSLFGFQLRKAIYNLLAQLFCKYDSVFKIPMLFGNLIEKSAEILTWKSGELFLQLVLLDACTYIIVIRYSVAVRQHF